MADRGDELVFQPVGLGQVLRHLVDGPAQAADLVVVFGVRQAGGQVAPGDAGGGRLHLAQRPHDGAHKKQPAPQHEQERQRADAHRGHQVAAPLAVHPGQTGDHAHGGDVARRVGHQRGNGHDPLPLTGGEDGAPLAVGGGEGLHKVGAVAQFLAHGAAAGGEHHAPGVQQHEFELILLVELFHGAAQGLAAALGSFQAVPGGAGGLQAARDGGKAALDGALHPAVKVAVAGVEEDRLGRHQHQHHDEQAAPYPALDDARSGHRFPSLLSNSQIAAPAARAAPAGISGPERAVRRSSGSRTPTPSGCAGGCWARPRSSCAGGGCSHRRS